MADTNANLKRVVTVAVSLGGGSLSRANMNIVTIFSSQYIEGVFDSEHRQLSFLSDKAVAETFGTSSSVYQHALAFFEQSPNPTQISGGRFVVSYYRAVEEVVPAKAGKLTGQQISEATTIGLLQSIEDGSFDIDIDGTTVNVTAIDGRVITSLDELVTILNTKITTATVSIEDQKIVITSDTTGATSLVTFTTEGASGTYIGEILALATGTGAIVVDGVDSETLAVETKLDAVNNATDFKFKGFLFIDNPTDTETSALSAYAQANDILYYDVFDSANNLTIDPANICWATKLANYTDTRMLFTNSGDRKFATRYMSRTHTVDFNGENTTLTMQLKELIGQLPDSYSDTELDNANKIGLDTYVQFEDTLTKVLSANGANGYTDLSYNIIALKNALQVESFNLIGTTSTKVPQTQTGVNQLRDTIIKVLKQFVKAGFLAPGTWNNADTFGDPETFKRNILQNGYFVKIQSLADQAQAEREQRKAPLVQIAVKTAGAFHEVNILVNIEE